jgi:hypothetical protein
VPSFQFLFCTCDKITCRGSMILDRIIFIGTCVHVCMDGCYVCVDVCVYVCMHACMHACMHEGTYICIFV